METSLKLERVNPQEGKGYTREATTICNTGSKMAQTRYQAQGYSSTKKSVYKPENYNKNVTDF